VLSRLPRRTGTRLRGRGASSGRTGSGALARSERRVITGPRPLWDTEGILPGQSGADDFSALLRQRGPRRRTTARDAVSHCPWSSRTSGYQYRAGVRMHGDSHPWLRPNPTAIGGYAFVARHVPLCDHPSDRRPFGGRPRGKCSVQFHHGRTTAGLRRRTILEVLLQLHSCRRSRLVAPPSMRTAGKSVG
jgi:hypothetical protein